MPVMAIPPKPDAVRRPGLHVRTRCGGNSRHRCAPDWLLVTFTCAGLKLQVGTRLSAAFWPVTEHVRFTAPVNPVEAETSTGVVIVPPAADEMLPVLWKKDNPKDCPDGFEHPAMHVIVTGAEGPDTKKLLSPPYVATMLFGPAASEIAFT